MVGFRFPVQQLKTLLRTLSIKLVGPSSARYQRCFSWAERMLSLALAAYAGDENGEVKNDLDAARPRIGQHMASVWKGMTEAALGLWTASAAAATENKNRSQDCLSKSVYQPTGGVGGTQAALTATYACSLRDGITLVVACVPTLNSAMPTLQQSTKFRASGCSSSVIGQQRVGCSPCARTHASVRERARTRVPTPVDGCRIGVSRRN